MSNETCESAEKTRDTAGGVPRREALKIAGALLVTGLTSVPTGSQTRRARKVIVGGAGIAGLSCAYELMKRGHDVTVDRKSTRLNSSHSQISYAVFCLKKKKNTKRRTWHPY